MTLKTTFKLKKELKAAHKQIERLEATVALLRHAELERATEFVNQQEITFALMDHIFDHKTYDVATLSEARNKWEKFKATINASESAQAAIQELDVDIIIHHEDNQQIVMNLWEKDRAAIN